LSVTPTTRNVNHVGRKEEKNDGKNLEEEEKNERERERENDVSLRKFATL